MDAQALLHAGSGAVFLVLGLVLIVRPAPLARPLALMTLLLSAYCVADVIEVLTQEPVWLWVEYAFAAWSGAALAAVLAGFLGLQKRSRTSLLLFRAGFIGIGLACVLALWFPLLRGFPGSEAWAVLMLIAVTGSGGPFVIRLISHAKSSPPDERLKVLLLGVAISSGAGGVLVDLLAMSGLNLPRVAAAGLAVSSIVLALLVLRTGLFTEIRMRQLAIVSALGFGATTVFIVSATVFAGEKWGYAFLVAFGGVFLVLLGWPIIWALADGRRQRGQLLALGTLANQMAHDLLNPVAAMKGAAQLMLSAQAAGEPVEPRYLELIVSKADQLERSVRSFERMGRFEPGQLGEVDLNTLLARHAETQRLVTGEKLQITLELCNDLPRVRIDADLVDVAFQNVIRNAAEAISASGRLLVRTERVDGPLGVRARVSFIDDGPGIPARLLGSIFEPGFTTKSSGRGLGLPQVRQVIEVHGGRVEVDSRPGAGTTVRIELPASAGNAGR